MLQDSEITGKLTASRRWLVVTAAAILAVTLAAMLLGGTAREGDEMPAGVSAAA